jgi:DNA-directed RNA polymerase beta' subunit
MKYELKYEYQYLLYPVHTFSAVGAIGGVHLHITDLGKKYKEKYGHQYSGGIEGHWRYPISNRPPSQKHCWLLGAPCWRDGSSLAAETWIHIWLSNNTDNILKMLEVEADKILTSRENIFKKGLQCHQDQ